MSSRQATAMQMLRRLSITEVDWEAVYVEQLPRIYNYFRFRLGSDIDVEELTAATFEKAWRSRQAYRRDLAGFSTWLFSIAQNAAIDYLRTRRQHLPLEAALQLPSEATPEHDAQHASDLARLAQLTNDLPERERELIALKYGAGLNNREIARLTPLSESNVGTILHRVVCALRERW
jgi:RNA polymerase sigma-70 factor (ECF subfamily)